MNIGLIDVDCTSYPNLVLMKLSAWHKSQGDTVDLLNPDDVLGGDSLFNPHDKLIGACVFTKNMGIVEALRTQGADVVSAGRKTADSLQDLQKAAWYLDREIERMKTNGSEKDK